MQTRQELTHRADLATIVGQTDQEFIEGVCSGYLMYYNEHHGKPINDLDIYTFIMQNIVDVRGTNTFNAGYCTGWMEALIEDRKVLN